MVAKLRIIFEIAKRFIKKLRVKDKRQQGQQKTTSATSLILLLIVIGVVYTLHEDFSIIYAVCHCLFE